MTAEPDDEPCELCGLCCKILGDGIAPTEMNLLRWMEDGRTDILRHFSSMLEDGRRSGAMDLRRGPWVPGHRRTA